jgi:hypothetical protein
MQLKLIIMLCYFTVVTTSDESIRSEPSTSDTKMPLMGGGGCMWDENNGFTFRWWDLLALRLQILLIIIITALSLIYIIYSSSLHAHYDSRSLLVVSWQLSSTHQLALYITMKSSCHVLFNYSGFSELTETLLDSLLYCTLLHCTTLYNYLSCNRSSLYRLRTDNTKTQVTWFLVSEFIGGLTEPAENISRGRYPASSLAPWLLPSNEL